MTVFARYEGLRIMFWSHSCHVIYAMFWHSSFRFSEAIQRSSLSFNMKVVNFLGMKHHLKSLHSGGLTCLRDILIAKIIGQ